MYHIETMTQYVMGRTTIRVWREETEFKTGPDPEVDRALNNIMTGSGLAKQVVDALKDLPRIAAIEVLDRDLNGVVYYPDWK
jgi:hypothetical protein